jgi:hypothetical protein
MEQQQMQPTQGKRKLNAFMMVVGIAVAVILIFSVLTVMFYRQAADFRESKYKAQYVLVDEIVTSISLATDAINEVLDDDLDNGWRRSSAQYATATVERISGACYGIEVMYPVTEDQSTTFQALKLAMNELADTIGTAYLQLTSPDRDVSESVGVSLENSTIILNSIRTLVVEGVDETIDWMEAPYDLLAGMNLEELAAAATDLTDAQ